MWVFSSYSTIEKELHNIRLEVWCHYRDLSFFVNRKKIVRTTIGTFSY